MLILFDVDATLITTSGIGVRAMGDAASKVLGVDGVVDRVDYAGSLDPLIIAELFRLAGRTPTAGAVREFRREYRDALARRLEDPAVVRRAMPGVGSLLDALGCAEGVCLGLLTGNFEETGRLKLQACGIDPDRFLIRVWGDESPYDPPNREHLPPLALDRYARTHGRSVEPRKVTIIGDTPHDVRCARASGCRSLGVATGRFSVEALRAAGADWSVQDLSQTDRVMEWLLGSGSAGA